MDQENGRTARLIGLDWGTSSLRGWLFDEAGQVLARQEAALGILAVRNADFAGAFESFCAPWLDRQRDSLPVIASGMIGSRQGWREAGYADTPARFDTIAEGLLALDQVAGRPFRIVPGLLTRPTGGSPDVLRGEETQVFGALQAANGSAKRLFVLPGTHSKWVSTANGAITGFRSYMTGEIFAVMREHSILGRSCAEPVDDDGRGPRSAFDCGVGRALAEPGALGHLLFTVRTEGLLGDRPADELPSYLSGLLIGAEVADALRVFAQRAEGAERPGPAARLEPRAEPVIIASPTLAARYRHALGQAGVVATIAAGEPAAAGLHALASRAGLVAPRAPEPTEPARP